MLQILTPIALVWVIAVIGLFGNTYSNNRLTKNGWILLLLLTLSSLLSGYTIYNEETIKTQNLLVKNGARKTVLFRLSTAVEDIKFASLWKKHDYFSKKLPTIDVHKHTLKMMPPSDNELTLSESLVRKPFERAVDNLRTINNRYSDYMSFNERDYVSLVLDTVENLGILQYLASIQGKNMNEYKNINDLYLKQNEGGGVQYFFVALSALEQEVKVSMNNEKKEHLKLRPECKNPIDSSTNIGCI